MAVVKEKTPPITAAAIEANGLVVNLRNQLTFFLRLTTRFIVGALLRQGNRHENHDWGLKVLRATLSIGSRAQPANPFVIAQLCVSTSYPMVLPAFAGADKIELSGPVRRGR
jgi:hypothetical protein